LADRNHEPISYKSWIAEIQTSYLKNSYPEHNCRYGSAVPTWEPTYCDILLCSYPTFICIVYQHERRAMPRVSFLNWMKFVVAIVEHGKVKCANMKDIQWQDAHTKIV
jgi:hypothetical protein